jgi:hypothetical protein
LEKEMTNATFTRFESKDCIVAYANRFISKYGDVLLVTEDLALNSTNPKDYTPVNIPSPCEIPYAWICGDGWDYDPFSMNTSVCTLPKAQNITLHGKWTLYGSVINYCLV